MQQSEYVNEVVKQCGENISFIPFFCLCFLLYIIGIFIAEIFSNRNERWKLRIYSERYCTGRNWRQRFPAASKEDIRAFLYLFCDEYLLSDKKYALKFKLDDIIYHVGESFGSQYEAYFLEMALEEQYGLIVEDEPNLHRADVTLGELFAVTQKYPRLVDMLA